jgi:hypothetical protein
MLDDASLFLSGFSSLNFNGPDGVQDEEVLKAFVAAIRGTVLPPPPLPPVTQDDQDPITGRNLELQRHREFVGREWLSKRAREWINSQPSGYLLVTGGPGVGKSAFVARHVAQDKQLVVFHFIKRGMGNWDDPEEFFVSLTVQLRGKYGLQQEPIEPGKVRTVFLANEFKRQGKGDSPDLLNNLIKGVFKKFRPASESTEDAAPTLTADQVNHIRQLAQDKARLLRLPPPQTNLLISSLMSSLALSVA